MKANAPEKIWMDLEWISHFDCKDCITEDSIEYTRTDAFVEKAAGWIDETLRNTDFYENEIELMVEEFKKAMKL